MIDLMCVYWYPNGTKHCRPCLGEAFRRVLVGVLGGTHGDTALGGDGECTLRCYVNSDYAGSPDDHKLTAGLIIMFEGAVDWRSRNLKRTAQSITDAEYNTFEVG
jgi:hypothetical protein